MGFLSSLLRMALVFTLGPKFQPFKTQVLESDRPREECNPAVLSWCHLGQVTQPVSAQMCSL